MADSSFFSNIISALRGTPATTTNLAAPISSYPTNDDAEYARKYGFSQGNENQGFLDNQQARVLGHQEQMPLTRTPLPQPDPRKGGFIPTSGAGMFASETMAPDASQVVDPQQAGLNGKLDNIMMRAALAANRSPIAALGFDPSKVVLDTVMKQGNLGGAYSKGADNIYSTISPDDSVVHESTHRGLQKLREQYPEANKLLGSTNSPDEETVVRWLMHSTAGDPEGHAGEVDAKQRQFAIDSYAQPYTGYKDNLNKLQEFAIDAMKNRGKRVGPQ